MLKNLFKKTDIKKNLFIATSGTAIAQVIHLLTTPILTRIYTPDAFGQFSIFLAIIGILTSLSTLKYDLAILISEDDEVSTLDLIIRKFSYFIALIAIICSFIFFFTTYQNYSTIFLFGSIGGLISSRFWTTRAISNKLGLFKVLSIAKVYENSMNSFLGILFGLIKPIGVGLIISKIIGLTSSYLYLKKRNNIDLNNKKSEIEVRKKYKRFPKYSLVADITSNLNLSLIIFIFTSLFGEENTGHIGLSTRVLSIPINFISISFLDVFRHRAIDDYKQSKSFDTIFLKFFKLLFILSMPLVAVLYLWGPELFSFIFGKEWLLAGEYSKYLVFLYSMRLISSPLSYSFSINEKQNINLYFQIAFVVFGSISILGSYIYFKNDILCIIYYTSTMFILNGFYLLAAYINSKKREELDA